MPQTIQELLQANHANTTAEQKVSELKKRNRTFGILYARYDPTATAEQKKLSVLLEGYFLKTHSTDVAYFFRAFSQFLSAAPTAEQLPKWTDYFYNVYIKSSAEHEINVSNAIRNKLIINYNNTNQTQTLAERGIDFNTVVGDLSDVVQDMDNANGSITTAFLTSMSASGRASRIKTSISQKQRIEWARTNAKRDVSWKHPLDRRSAGKEAAAKAKKDSKPDFDQYVYKLWQIPKMPTLLPKVGRSIDEQTLDTWAADYLGSSRLFPQLNLEEEQE